MQHFGTDGIRGKVLSEIFPKDAFCLGVAVAKCFKQNGKIGCIVVGKDTRASSDMLEAALSCGICCGGINVLQVGVVTTAAVSYLTKKYAALGGVMITGSHNAPQFNGFMVFDQNGFKIDKNQEQEIEAAMLLDSFPKCATLGQILKEDKGRFDYLQFLKSATDYNLSGLKVRLDLCHGSACLVAQEAFENNGANVVCDNSVPDGERVNNGCGTENTSRFCGAVVRSGADVGFCFDADADRVLAVDECGKLVDGDKILYLFAVFLKEQERLLKNTAAGTALSSLALEKALNKQEIALDRCQVGAQNVARYMHKNGLMIGGEAAGKLILRDYLPTADGILVALFVAKIIKQKGKKLSELVKEVKDLPREQKSFIMNKDKKRQLETDPNFIGLLDRLMLSEKGLRIIARASGTEDAFRIIIEASTEFQLKRALKKVEQYINSYGR